MMVKAVLYPFMDGNVRYSRKPWWSACFCPGGSDWQYTSKHDEFYCINCYSWMGDPICSSGDCDLCINRPLLNEEAKAFDEKVSSILEDDLISFFGER